MCLSYLTLPGLRPAAVATPVAIGTASDTVHILGDRIFHRMPVFNRSEPPPGRPSGAAASIAIQIKEKSFNY